MTATHSHVKLANPAYVAVHASQYTDTFDVVAMTLSALCSQVDDADAVTSDEQAVERVVRRRVKVNRMAKGRAAASRAEEDLADPVASVRGRNVSQGRAVGVPMEGREPQMGLVSISTAWQVEFGIGNSFCSLLGALLGGKLLCLLWHEPWCCSASCDVKARCNWESSCKC